MKRIFYEEIVINKELEQVWSYFRNFENASTWMVGVDSLRVHLDSLPLKEGSILESTVNGNRQRLDVLEYEQEKKLVLRSVIGHYQKNYSYHFEKNDVNTKVGLEVSYEAQGFVTKIVSLFINKMIKKQEYGQLTMLKTAVEKSE